MPLGYLQFHTSCLTYLGYRLSWFGILLNRIFALLGFAQRQKSWPAIWSQVIILSQIMAQLDQLFSLLNLGFHPLLQYPSLILVQQWVCFDVLLVLVVFMRRPIQDRNQSMVLSSQCVGIHFPRIHSCDLELSCRALLAIREVYIIGLPQAECVQSHNNGVRH